MNTLIRYQLTTDSTQILSMPSGAVVLGAFTDKKSNSLQILAVGDLNIGLVDHTIYVRAVGDDVDDINLLRDKYLGTYQESEITGSSSYSEYGVWDGGE